MLRRAEAGSENSSLWVWPAELKESRMVLPLGMNDGARRRRSI